MSRSVGSGKSSGDGSQPWNVGCAKAVDVVADETGRIYALDAIHRRIHVYAPDGEFLQTIGRPGERPGELSRPEDLHLMDGTLRVHSWANRRYRGFDRDGEFVGDIPGEGDGYPDCVAREVHTGRRLRLEFEPYGRRFREHGHNPDECDMVVCWRDDYGIWPAGVEVLELAHVVSTKRPDLIQASSSRDPAAPWAV